MPIEALVPGEIAWMQRYSAASEIGRRPDNHQPQVAGHRNGAHVLVDDFAKLNARIVPVCDDVHRCIAHDKVELDVRVCREKSGKQ